MSNFMKQVEVFKSEIDRYLEISLFLQVYKLVLSSGVASQNSSEEWLKTLIYMHLKGWLFFHKEEGQLVSVVGAYRVKEYDKKLIDKMPDKEEGDILFVVFAASKADDKQVLVKMLRKYKEKNPDIKKVLMFKEETPDEPIEYVFKTKEGKDV